MCGITGQLAISNSEVISEDIECMVQSLAHRGPNDKGVFCAGPIGLGHTRLSIFDLSSAGHQPMHSPDKRFVIIHNGEVYNWPEIRLKLKNYDWRSQTDTETILHAYMEWGEECLQHFNGMFAFAIWDQQKRQLFLARDRVGIKPLFYGVHGGRFYFGSEVKAFFAAGFSIQPNFGCIFDFLYGGLIEHGDESFYEGITSLNPSHYLLISAENGNITKKCYWNLPEIVNNSSELKNVSEDYEALVHDAVNLRLRADVPVGVFLSGGIDSSILSALLAKNYQGENLKAYTYEFDTGQAGEGQFAREVADYLNFDSEVVQLSYKDVPEYFKKVLFHQEAPVTSLRVLSTHLLYERVRDSGTVVILEGHGGDHLGAGFEYYFMAHLMDRLRREGATEQIFVELKNFLTIYKVSPERHLEKLFQVLGAVLHPGSATTDGTPFVKAECFDTAFLDMHSTERLHYPQFFENYLLNAQYTDFYSASLQRVLRHVDRASMAVGIEARVPFLDHRLVELSFRTSVMDRIAGDQQRVFMREAARNMLPDYILNRPKRSIVDPQRNWLKTELKTWVADIFHSSTFRNRGIFNQKTVIQEYNNYCKTKNPKTSFHFFQYLNIELWFQTFIDKKVS
jgi:asparagine synthase (glutamine-hydrolysing)